MKCSNKRQLYILIADVILVFLCVFMLFNPVVSAREETGDNGGGKHNKNMFTTDRMIESLNKVNTDPEMTIYNVLEAVNDFVKDTEQFDDLTTLCLKYNGKE